jgi:hypothetical protein
MMAACLHSGATSHAQASTSPLITLWVAFARPYFAYGFIANSSSCLHVSGGAEEWGIRVWISDAIGIPAWGTTTGPADVMAFLARNARLHWQ